VWLGVAVALVAVRLAFNEFVPGLAHDSFQYLSVAEQALRGRLGETSIVHFDAERSFAVAPAPLVTFPLGYPALIALLGLTGIALPYAALLINLAAVLTCIPVMWWITGQLGIARLVRHAVMACTVLNGSFLLFAATVSTEMLFTSLVLGGSALLLRARLGDGGALWRWVAAGLVFGLAYHVRYAGLFLVIALAVVAARHVVTRNRDLVVGYGAAFAAACTLVAVGIGRNLVLVGNWRGGNEKPVSNALSTVLEQTVRAASGLVLGPFSPSDSYLPRALFAFLVLLLAAMLFKQRTALQAASAPDSRARGFVVDLAIIVAVYSAFMFYAALTTVISYGTRMFVPLVPLLAVLTGAGLSALGPPVSAPGSSSGSWSVRSRWSLAAVLVVYAIFNLLSLRLPLVDRFSHVIAQMNAITDSGITVRDVVAKYAGDNRVIVANNGQAIGYVLRHPTISLVGPHYSQTVWDEAAVRDLVRRYEAAVVVITAPNAIQPNEDDLIPAPFVSSLAQGQSPPWLRLVSRAGSIFVYVPVSL
jgi:hypothetical protein